MSNSHRLSVVDLFDRQAQFHPECIAATCRGHALTYRALQARSSGLAQRLWCEGVGRRSRVVVATTRSLEMLVAFLAVLRTGACLVPLDHESLSHGAIRAIIDRTRPEVVISTVPDAELQTLDVRTIPCHDQNDVEHLPRFVCESIHMEDPVYLIFTSGTTGKPKGVMVPQRALANYVQSNDPGLPFNMSVQPGERVFLVFSPAFDACLGVVFSTVCNGGELVISTINDATEHVPQCDILPCTPSILRTFNSFSHSENVRKIFLGGEAPSESLVKHWTRHNRRIFNAYGPSETTTASLISELVPGQGITLGQPMRDSNILLINSDGNEGDEGEVWISGPGLAIGYLDDQELTDQKFAYRDQIRYYKTGDYARRRDRNLFFLGRADSMVKHSGFLINLETEVIPTLLRQVDVADATAVMVGPRLIGVVAPEHLDGQSIRSAIAETNSSFIVPDEIFTLASIPVNSRGKVDLTAIRSEISSQMKTVSIETTALSADGEILRSAAAKCFDRPTDQVNMDATFWENGGNSLAAMHLISILHTAGKALLLADIMSEETLRHQSSRLQSLRNGSTLQSDDFQNMEPISLSLIQRQMLTASVRKTSSHWLILFIEMPAFLVDAQVRSLRDAFLALLQRHSALRSEIDLDQLQQNFDSGPEIRWETVDTTAEQWVVRNQTNIDILDQQIAQLDLGKPSHFFRLIRNDRDGSVLYWLAHHARMDGRSAEILIHELRCILDDVPLPPAPQYTTAIQRHQEILRASDSESRKDFIKRTHERQLLAEPVYFENSASSNGLDNNEDDGLTLADAAGLRASTSLPLPRLHVFSARHRLTTSTVLYAAWAKLLSSYTDSAHVCFDIVLSGRNLDVAGANDMVGPMLNIVPLPVTVPASDSGATESLRWLHEVQDQVLRASDAQWHFADPALRRQGPCDSLVSFHKPAGAESWSRTGSSSGRIPGPWKVRDVQISDAPLTLLMCDGGERLDISILARALGAMPFVKRMLEHFQIAVLDLLESESGLVKHFLPQSEVEELTQISKCETAAPDTASGTLVNAFRLTADAFGQSAAVESGQTVVTFHELDTMSGRTAAGLARFASSGDIVASLADGSIEWIVGLLAILKVGGVYCPIDVNQSTGRTKELLKACRAHVILAPRRNDTLDVICVESSQQVVYVEDHALDLRAPPMLPIATGARDPAFLIYTSGTTGEPKGVSVSSEALLSYISHPPARLFAAPGRRIAQVFSVGFDACLAEVFGTLCNGSTLVLKDSSDFTANLRTVNAAMMTPSLAASLNPIDFTNLDTVLFGGEPVSQALADAWAKGRRLFNGYGLSECTIGSIFKELSGGRQSITLGCPIPGNYVYILDRNMRLSPQGVPGEIFLSGRQVALGYHSCKDADRDRFVSDPFRTGLRMFRTGDRGRWNENMEVEYIGRRDRQIKLNGYRMNLDEMEKMIKAHWQDATQVAILKHDDSLHVFVQSNRIGARDAAVEVSSVLPHYARPLHVHPMAVLPLTRNQKADHKALIRQITSELPIRAEQLEHPLDTAIYRAWTRTLPGLTDRMQWSGNETFFELGGNSFLALQLTRRLSDEMNCAVPISLVLQDLTISQQRLALHDLKRQQYEAQNSLKYSDSEAVREEGHSTQQATVDIYRFCAAFTCKSVYNMAVLFHIRGPLKVGRLHAALQRELNAHVIFRARFDQGSKLSLAFDVPRATVVLRDTQVDASYEVANPFDLEAGPLVRVSMSTPTSDSCKVLFVVHHSILDLESLESFFKRVSQRYAESRSCRQRRRSAVEGIRTVKRPRVARRPSLPPSNPSMTRLKSHNSFWTTYLRDAPAPPLFSAQPVRPIHNEDGFISTHLPSYLGRITRACDEYGVSPQQLIIGCLSRAVQAIYQVSDLVVWIPTAGDGASFREDLAGSHLDRLPVRVASLRGPETFSWRESFRGIRESVEVALRHVMPSSSIQAMLPTHLRDGVPQELSAFMVSYQPLRPPMLSLPGCEIEVERVRAPGAKFPFMLEVSEDEDEVVLAFEYMRASIADEEAARLAGNCERILRELCVEEAT